MFCMLVIYFIDFFLLMFVLKYWSDVVDFFVLDDVICYVIVEYFSKRVINMIDYLLSFFERWLIGKLSYCVICIFYEEIYVC